MVCEREKEINIKNEKMRSDFKFINGREVRIIGYDREKLICVIQYSHYNGNSNSTYYYYNVEPELWDEIINSGSIARTAEKLFKDKSFTSN